MNGEAKPNLPTSESPKERVLTRQDYMDRPRDWISHLVSLPSSSPSATIPTDLIEVIEMPFGLGAGNHTENFKTPVGCLLMIPGFFQNGACFDLLPERGISLARFLMRELGLKIYLLNVRGVGNSRGGRRLGLDDLATKDIPVALSWVAAREKQSLFVFGHSQGGHMLQACVGGLTHDSKGNAYFDPREAQHRQELVRGIAVSAGNVFMTTDKPRSGLLLVARGGHAVKKLLRAFLDRVQVKILVRAPLLRYFAYTPFWEFLFHRANVSRESMMALHVRTLDGSWWMILEQYIDGILSRAIKTKGERQVSYGLALAHLQRPFVQVTYRLDPMAEPEATRRDHFNHVASATKKFYVIEDRGHEDFMMNERFHADWLEPLSWLVQNSAIKKWDASATE